MHDAEEVSRALNAPFRFHRWLQIGAFVSGVVVAPIAVRFVSREAAIAAGAVAMIVTFAGYWVWYLRSRYLPAIEALADHDRAERAAWHRTTGTAMPRNRAQARRWLANEPANTPAPGSRIPLLQWIGDLAGAQREIDRFHPRSASEEFDAEIARGTQAYLEGRPVDLEAVRSAYLTLDDPADRRHGRVCLAILEARVGLAEGADPYEPILVARQEMDGVDPAVSIGLTTRRVAGILAAAVAVFVVVALKVS